MKSPFPGMDPYLEAPEVFPDFHERLATMASEQLNAHLPRPYYARLEMRSEVGIVEEGRSRRRIVPDVVIMTPPRVREAAPSYAAVAGPRTEISPGVLVHIPTEPYQHPFVEIRDAAHGHRLVTLIEIVSPSNKRLGADRKAYEAKQTEILNSDANLIEIDLLRSGERLLPSIQLQAAVERLNSDYLILINRSQGRQGFETDYLLYPVLVREGLPCIPVPLAGDTPDLPLDLQTAFERVYLGGPYPRMIDYTLPPGPPLTEEDVAWADGLLREAGLRPAATP